LGHKVKIGNDVWIGANVFINASTVSEIGDGAVIGAGAIVTHNVPPYSVVLGIPGKVVKYRFLEGRIAELLEIKWWNWTDDEIRANLDFFAKTDGKV
jgi:acetyltransferase-like isoleucine patch superfamily enzyme